MVLSKKIAVISALLFLGAAIGIDLEIVAATIGFIGTLISLRE